MRVTVKNTASRCGWLRIPVLSGLRKFCAPALLTLGVFAWLTTAVMAESYAFRQTAHPAQAPHAAPAPQNHPAPQARPEVRSPAAKPGQQHLPEWWNNHRNLTPAQQADALRREPGFRNLPQDQQQRLINRLQSLDAKTPEQRQRTLERNENFERLSPERRQEVRGAAQALKQMSPDREQVVRRAFQQLRHMPPNQREQLLKSSVYGGQFSPQERTVLGNLLSIEPYEPQAVPQPYFGRR